MKVVLIIEDDYPFAVEIEMMLVEVGGYITKIVSTFKEAKTILASLKPDIILSDIFLDGKYSIFDILNESYKDIPLILFSSEDNDDVYKKTKLLKSYIFLIKPFNVKSLKSAVDNLLEDGKLQSKTIFLKTSGKHMAINSDDIRYIESDGNDSIIYLMKGKLITRSTFQNIIQKIDDSMFIRVHRGYVVNQKFIKSIQSSTHITMNLGENIPIGRSYKTSVRALFI